MRLFSRAQIPAFPLTEHTDTSAVSSPRIDSISGALAKAQGSVEAAIRTRTAKGDNFNDGRDEYDYADLDDVMVAIRDAAAANSLAVVERFPPGKKALHCILVHGSGQWIDYGLYELGNYNTHKEKGSAITYGRRHMRKCIFGVADRDDDATDAGVIRDEDLRDGISTKPGTLNIGTPTGVKHLPPGYTPSDPLRPHKNLYALTVRVLDDGTLDYDGFVALMEDNINATTDGAILSLWNRANSKTLDAMERDRPDLFKYISGLFITKGQQLM